MKKNDFDQFMISLNLNIKIDSAIRRITEKIKLLSHLRDNESLDYVSYLLNECDTSIDTLISNSCKDESEE